MQEISILELHELKTKQETLIVLYYLKDNLISDLACINLEKLRLELNIPIYKLSLDNDNFEEPLPIISFFEDGIIKSRLYGFQNLKRTKEFLEQCI